MRYSHSESLRQLDHDRVSFCFLLWGLSAVASSINLLVLKFMTISLEEEDKGEDELHEMGANIVTLDEEVEDTIQKYNNDDYH